MKPVNVIYKNGQKETLTPVDLTNIELYQFIDFLVAGRTPAIITLCAKRNDAWINSLTTESMAEVARAFVSENFSRATVIVFRDPVAAMKYFPFQKALDEMQRSFISDPGLSSATTPNSDESNGDDSPKTPAPPAAADETPAPANA